MTTDEQLLQIQSDLQTATQSVLDISEQAKSLSSTLTPVQKQAAIQLSNKLSAFNTLVLGAIVALDVAVALRPVQTSSSSSSSSSK
jgi:hypothetical protein